MSLNDRTRKSGRRVSPKACIAIAVLVLVIACLGIFVGPSAAEYISARVLISRGEILAGREKLGALEGFLHADRYLEENAANHALALMDQGLFVDGYELLQQSEGDSMTVLKDAVVKQLLVTEDRAMVYAEYLMAGFSQPRWLERVFLESELLDQDPKAIPHNARHAEI